MKRALIGVGGIMSGADAAEKIRLGADLVQLYTGFIYRGPELISESSQAISSVFRRSVKETES
jgi:dihydroorotate dehydrogenase